MPSNSSLDSRWNTPKFTPEFAPFHATHTPKLMQSYRPIIEPFAKRVYETGIKLLRLISLALEIPEEHGGEEFLSKLHAYGNENGFAGDTWRYMLYHKTTDDHDKANDFTRIGGHTDAGTLTLLFSHPIMGLQMQMPDGTYKWVRHEPGAIIVNMADVLQFITGGFLKSTVHRVVTPPKDQRQYDRLGLLYFLRPEIHLDLSRTIWRESPVVRKHLQALGKPAEVLEKEEREQAAKGPIEVGEWINERVKKIFTPVNNYVRILALERDVEFR
jgi:isopenicillin N synthase-like dioxygenase